MASVTGAGGGGGQPPAPGQPVKLYVGHLPPSIPRRDLEDLFGKYGRVVSLEIKHGGFAFVEYEDTRDAEDAINALNNYPLDGERITVEWSRRSNTGASNCFICGSNGHWARECPENKEQGLDVRSGKCFKCGVYGHLARYCRGGGGGDRDRSRSPGPGRGYRDRRRSISRDRGGRYDDRRRSPPRGPRYDDPYRRDDYYDYRDRRRSPDALPPPRSGGDYRRDNRRGSYEDRGYPPYGGDPRGPPFDPRGPPPMRGGGGYDDYPPPPHHYRGGAPPDPFGRDRERDRGGDRGGDEYYGGAPGGYGPRGPPPPAERDLPVKEPHIGPVSGVPSGV
ncbi:hypothetical protein HDU76_000799 [Blyttiomyces sp. JEL0837]|nr:hypothetical protein HDU76_000799 [Blyttiomyces sp. JEL0837]